MYLPENPGMYTRIQAVSVVFSLSPAMAKMGRRLHSFASQLNLSALCGIGGARRDCVARVKGVLGGV